MKRITSFFIVCLLSIVGIAFSAPQNPAPPSAAWSQEVNGLERRLSANFVNLKNGPREVMTLEFRNVSTEPITVSTQPDFIAQLFDDHGNKIPQVGIGSLISGGPDCSVIPGGDYLRFQVNIKTDFAPYKNAVLLCMKLNIWYLKPGQYTLQSTMLIRKYEFNKDQWAGEMKLPSVTFVVTDEQVAK